MQQVQLERVDLNLLKVFVALYEEGSVTDAGARLGLAQSSMSHALTRLRAALDDQLFVRGSAGMTPTPYAAGLIAPVQRILQDLQLALDRGRAFDPATSDRTFTVIMTDLLEMILLPQLLAHLANAAPNIKVVCRQMDPTHYREAFETGGADVALGQLTSAHPDFYQQRLVAQPFSCFVRVGHPLARRLTLDDFMAAQHLIVNPVSMGEMSVKKALGARASQRRVVLQVPHYMIAPFVLAATNLIAVFPTALDRHFLGLGTIVSLPVPFPIEPGVTNQYWHKCSNADPGCQWLRRTIHTLFLDWERTQPAGPRPVAVGDIAATTDRDVRSAQSLNRAASA